MLGELYRLKSITPHHESIAKIPWIRTYTTNYDDAFEIAHSQIGKTHTTVTPSSPTKQPKKANIILHINGFINTCLLYTSARWNEATPDSAANTVGGLHREKFP